MDPDTEPLSVPSTLRSEPSIKRFLRHLRHDFSAVSSDLATNSQSCRQIASETSSLHLSTTSTCNNIMTTTLDAVERLTRTFQELQKEQKSEDLFLWRQLGALNADRVKQEQSVRQLMSRVGLSEDDVGTELRLPSVD